MNTPEEIKKLRDDLGVTQRELAEIIGVTDAAVAQWEMGKRVPDRRAQAILQKLRERTSEEGASLAESLLTIAGTAGLVMVLSKLFED